MGKDLDKTYDPHSFEDRLYAFWQEKGYFSPVVDHDKKPYSIMMPPPNITGQLHLGHALDNTLQDILIRFKRMQGYCTLWLPGTDHASIATEAKVVEAMVKEGLTKEGVGREGNLWQPHQRADQASGQFLRLEPGALYHGRGLFPGGTGSVRQPV